MHQLIGSLTNASSHQLFSLYYWNTKSQRVKNKPLMKEFTSMNTDMALAVNHTLNKAGIFTLLLSQCCRIYVFWNAWQITGWKSASVLAQVHLWFHPQVDPPRHFFILRKSMEMGIPEVWMFFFRFYENDFIFVKGAGNKGHTYFCHYTVNHYDLHWIRNWQALIGITFPLKERDCCFSFLVRLPFRIVDQ